MIVTLRKSKLSGKVLVPPSKSLSHRMLIAAALSNQKCRVSNLVFSADINATIEGLSKLGSKFFLGEDYVDVLPCEVKGGNIDCNESGSTVRFLIPIAMTKIADVIFTGRNNLVNRPLDSYLDIFKKKGIRYEKGESYLPLHIMSFLTSGIYEIKGDVSSQFVTGLLFALPLLNGDSRIVITTRLESKGYVDLTLDVLSKFGIEVINKDYQEFIINGNQVYKPVNTVVEGDFSQAAFWLVAGAIGGNVKLEGMNIESHQGDKEIISFLENMGLKVHFEKEQLECLQGRGHGTVIDLSQAPDLGPIITVLAALSEGQTKIINASRLRIKECDRITAITTELNKIGAKIEELSDGMIIEGVSEFTGGVLDSWNDHRIAMALAIASLKASGPIIINQAECINKSYPHFFEHFKSLGGNVEYEHNTVENED